MSQLLQNAACGTALILAAALLRRALGDRLAPEARLALWAVCLFRLLTPAAPESALSLWGPLSRLFQAAALSPAAPAAPQLYTLPQDIPAAEPGVSWAAAPAILWTAVGGALAVRYGLSWRRTRRAVACTIPLDRSDGRYAALPKCVRLREGPMEGAPLTFGALRPTVVLAPGLNGAELDCVLAHEGVHASRRDNLWHYAMALAAVVHWWNPAVWLMSRLLRRDIELSCDRAALRRLGAERRADYARALVSLATRTEGPAFCQTFGRRAAEERIRSIMKFKKTSAVGAIFTLTLVLAVTAAFASEPKTPPAEYDSAKLSEQIVSTTDGAANPDLPTYVEVDVDIEGKLSSDKGVTVENYEVVLPDFVEGEIADGVTGSYFYSYSIEAGETAPSTIEVRVAELTEDSLPLVYSYSLCDDGDCGVEGSHAHIDGQVIQVQYQNPYDYVEAGPASVEEPDSAEAEFAAPSDRESMAAVYEENGYSVDENGYGVICGKDGEPFMKARWGYLPCIRTDCGIAGPHVHDAGQVAEFPR